MNISSVVSVVKGFAASEGGKAVAKVVKTVGDKAVKGITVGAGAGALVAGVKIGYEFAVKGVPAVIHPVIEILDKMAAGEPSFTVTFSEVKSKEKAEEKNNADVQPETEKQE